MLTLAILISLIASTVGAICGIGGGVIIKPTLDLFQITDVPTANFLSGCTVLAMTLYAVGKSLHTPNSNLDLKAGTPLAIGAALGGIVGNSLFSFIADAIGGKNEVGAIQSGCLLVITLAALVYAIRKDRIQTHTVGGTAACLAIGTGLGVMSSFLAIGGGPINLVALFYFFSMDAKSAATTSLYIILLSQAASLAESLVLRPLPPVGATTLLGMMAAGVLGGIIGQAICKRIDSQAVNRLFLWMMVAIVAISAHNLIRFYLAAGN